MYIKNIYNGKEFRAALRPPFSMHGVISDVCGTKCTETLYVRFLWVCAEPTKFTTAEKELQCIAGWHRKFLGIVLLSETLLAYNQDTGPLSQHECLSSSFFPYNFSIKFKAKTWTFCSYFPTLQPPHHSSLGLKTFTHTLSKTPIRSKPRQESIKPCSHEIQITSFIDM